MEIYMKENGVMIKLMEKENIFIKVLHMKEIGKMINKMVMVQKHGMMALDIQVILLMEKKKEKGNIYGQMALLMKENLKIVHLMEKGNIYGIIIEFMMEIGKIIK